MNITLQSSFAMKGNDSQSNESNQRCLVVFSKQGTAVKADVAKKPTSKKTADGGSGKAPTGQITHGLLNKLLAAELEQKTITGKFQEVVYFRRFDFEGFHSIMIVGLGNETNPEKIRQLAACVHGKLESEKIHHVDIHFDGISGLKKSAVSYVGAFVEGLRLTDYKFNELKSDAEKSASEKKAIQLRIVSKFSADNHFKSAVHDANIISECVNFSRRLGDMPGNLMTPTILADSTIAAAKGTGLKVEAWDKARIKKEKMGGLLGVSEGSDQEPRFIIMKYNGAAKADKPVVFVGKGLTFDSGGISLKPGAGMEEMKYDMCGGANVIGTMLAIARLKLKVNAIGLVPSTENMPGGSATKPGDVHTARNGKTFEINNTDAEGRLILSDALCYGSEQNPAVMIDAATLTGAIVIALGNVYTGYFTKNNSLRDQVQKAADASGELVWQMPLHEFHTKDMKGTFADLSNMSSSKGAGSATAAAFLEQFVGEGIPWAHFDIAGTAWATGSRFPYCPKKGASGVMVRTFLEIAKQYE